MTRARCSPLLTVGLGFGVRVAHAFATKGLRAAAVLIAVTTGGGLAVEAVGVATGFPFGAYAYGALLGPKVLGVPLVIPLAWTWMAWPAWLAAGQLARRTPARVALAGLGLAAWDLFLDPQMVDRGVLAWTAPGFRRPARRRRRSGGATTSAGSPSRYSMMAAFAAAAGPRGTWSDRRDDAPMLALYLWTYLSSVLAHAVFLGPARLGAVGWHRHGRWWTVPLLVRPVGDEPSRPLGQRASRWWSAHSDRPHCVNALLLRRPSP